jgi:hypothetical protein
MMKSSKIALMAGVAAGLLASAPSWAGAKLKIDDESMIDLGFRVQSLMIQREVDLDGDGSWDDDTDFRVRRARLRAKLDVNQYISAFIQTEAADDEGGTGSDMRVIDSWINLKYNNWLQLQSGQTMAPSSRQTTTSSGAMMTIDRPGINTKNLTWGTRSTYRFATSTLSQTDAGLRGDNAVRDVGAVLWGTGSFSDTMHLKYYAGMFDGVQDADTDDNNLRFTGRVQFNMFDAEPGYYNLSTYLGGKKTLGFGASYDMQDEVANNTLSGGTADYEFWSVDAFMDWPLGPGSLTVEAAYSDLDLDRFDEEAAQAQGNGWYVQAGYYINKWQPWVEYEEWDGDAFSGDFGNYSQYRVGVSYFFKGHNANVKLGYEYTDPDENFSGTTEDDTNTIVLGFYTTY